MLDTLISHTINVLELHYLPFLTFPYHLLPLTKVHCQPASPHHVGLVVPHLGHLETITKVILEASQQACLV